MFGKKQFVSKKFELTELNHASKKISFCDIIRKSFSENLETIKFEECIA